MHTPSGAEDTDWKAFGSCRLGVAAPHAGQGRPPTARSVKRGRLSRDEIETLAPKTSTSCGGDPGPDSEVAGME